MRRFLSSCLMAAALLGSSLSLGGCIVVPPRGGYHARVWAPGYWAPEHIRVRGRWRHR